MSLYLVKQLDHLLDQLRAGQLTPIKKIQSLYQRFPAQPYVLFAMGCVHMEKGEAEQALSFFNRCLDKPLKDKMALERNRLICYAMLGDVKAFEQNWPRAIDPNKKNQAMWQEVLRACVRAARVKKDIDMIEAIVARWQSLNPDDFHLRLTQVGLLQERDEKTAAAKCYQEIQFDEKLTFDQALVAAEIGRSLNHPYSLRYLEHAYHNRPKKNTLSILRLAALFEHYKQFERAYGLLEAAIAHQPTLKEPNLYKMLNISQQANWWNKVERLIPQYLDAVRSERVRPGGLFRHLSLPGLTDADHLMLANAYQKGFAFNPSIKKLERFDFSRMARSSRRLKIGYLSSDFKSHPVAQLFVSVLENHNRELYEIIGYDIAEDDKSLLRERVLKGFDQVYPVRELNEEELVSKIRADDIDVLFDLNGDTTDTRCWVLRYRVAPVQVGWLGFPGGLGKGINDYIVADARVIPESSYVDYAEAPVLMPHTYLPNDPQRTPMSRPSRIAVELPEEATVFCCFNGQYKITREMFEAWCEILKQVDDSVLWLRDENPDVIATFKLRAEELGVAPSRLIFAPRTEYQVEHLTRLQCADIALDTRPYNSHTTCVDALWAGVPMVTLPGQSFTSRVASSILTVAGLSQCIANSKEAYIRIAVDLAKDRSGLRSIKQGLMDLREKSVLFDSVLFTRHLEQGIERMFAQYEAKMPVMPIQLENQVNNTPLNQGKTSRAIPLMFEQAQSHLNREELSHAKDGFEAILALEPHHAGALHGLGLVYGLAGHYEQALELLERACKQDSDNERYKKNLSIMQKKAKDNYASYLDQTLRKAKQQHQSGALQGAIELYQTVIDQSPYHPEALHYMGLAEVQLGDGSGLERMKLSLKINPHNKDFENNYRRAQALLKGV